MIKVTDEFDTFTQLYETSWSGAISRLDEIQELGLEDEFMEYLEEVFYDYTPTRTEINDFIWFEVDEWIEEHKGGEEND